MPAMSRYSECLARVRRYAEELAASGVNQSAIEGLLESYVEQPAFDRAHRESLVREAMRHIGM